MDKLTEAEVARLEKKISDYNTKINYLNNLISKIKECQSYLNEAKLDFKNGGHVLNDVPLQAGLFNKCATSTDNFIDIASNKINSYNEKISKLQNRIRTEKISSLIRIRF